VQKVLKQVWTAYVANETDLGQAMLSVVTNRCELLVCCVGDVYPVNDCPQCRHRSGTTKDEQTPVQLELDDPLGAGDKWTNSKWFLDRLPCARKQVHTHIHHQYNLWTTSNFDWARVVSGQTVHDALVKGVGKAWVEAWIGVEAKAVKRLDEEVLTFVKENLRAKLSLASKPSGKKVQLDKRLAAAGGITDEAILQPGTRIEALWCDKFGRQEKKKVRSGRGLSYRQVVAFPGWHKGTIAGLGPRDWPGTYRIEFDDETTHDNTPRHQIRLLVVAQ
jgi:hypothetical protein